MAGKLYMDIDLMGRIYREAFIIPGQILLKKHIGLLLRPYPS